jgi:hypothetical protein
LLQLVGWHGPGTGDMTRRVLGRRPDVDDHGTRLHEVGKLPPVHGPKFGPVAQIGRCQPVDARDVLGSDVAQHRPQLGHAIAGEPVVDPRPVSPRGHESRAGQGAQMVGGVGEALPDLLGEFLHRPLPLGEDVDELGTPTAGQRASRLGERVEERLLGCAAPHGRERRAIDADCQVII